MSVSEGVSRGLCVDGDGAQCMHRTCSLPHPRTSELLGPNQLEDFRVACPNHRTSGICPNHTTSSIAQNTHRTSK